MENLMLSLNVISPLLMMLALGVVLRKINFFSDHVVKTMNKLVALVLLPILVFKNIYQAETDKIFHASVLIFCFVAILAEFVAAFCIVFLLTKDPQKRGVMVQGMFRSNYVIFGIPVAVSLYGEEGSSAAAILTTVVIPCFNILAVFALELFHGKQINFKYIGKKIITNPLILASAVGLLFSGYGLQLPYFIEKPVVDLADAATPMAFLFLGASLAFHSIQKHFKELSFTVFTRLILFPLIVVSIAVWIGFRDVWLVVILTVFASPTAVSSFSLAQTLGGDDKLAGNIVVFTTFFSILTMFLWVFCLKTMLLI